MSSPLTEIADLTYNAAQSAFEAVVTVHDGPKTARYAARLEAPLTAAFETVSAGMASRALKQHRSRNPGLRARLIADNTPLPLPNAELTQIRAVLEGLLKRAA